MKEVMIVTGAGQIGMAIARRVGAGMKIVIGDKPAGMGSKKSLGQSFLKDCRFQKDSLAWEF